MDAYDALLSQIKLPIETCLLETRHGLTHVLIAGPDDAPPVILWHGMGACAPTWANQINRLAQEYRIYAPDTPGSMGKSAPQRPPRNGPAYGEWMIDVLAGLGIASAYMAGISLGGWLICKLAILAPEKIEGAVLISSGGIKSNSVNVFFRMAPMLILSPFLSADRKAQMFLRVMSPPGQQLAEQDRTLFAVMLHDFKFEGNAPSALSDDDLRCLTAPTCLLMGEYEAAFEPLGVIQRAKAILPNLQRAELVPGVGHGMISEDPDTVNQHILHFIKSIADKKAPR